MPDYEDKIRKLAPTIRWSECEETSCRLPVGTSQVGRVTIPADYDHPEDGHFPLYFHRYTNTSTEKPKAHVIIMEGGPGYRGIYYNFKVEYILKGLPNHPVAFYLFDHRGLGNSGAIGFPGKGVLELKDELDMVIKNAPFHVSQLTVRNNALDVVALAIAIQNDPSSHPESTLHVKGESYGAYLGNYVVNLAPNLFTSAQLSSSPMLRGGPPATAQGLAMSCALDDYCRQRIGPNVYERQRQAIRNILDYTTNSCTKALGDSIKGFAKANRQERLVKLAEFMKKIVTGRVSLSYDDQTFSGQLLLLGLVATSDCVRPDCYKEEILKPLKSVAPPYSLESRSNIEPGKHEDDKIDGFKLRESKYEKLYYFMKDVLFIDMIFHDGDGKWVFPSTLDEINDATRHPLVYGDAYELLKPYLNGREFSNNVPLKTTKTQIFIESGLVDLITPYSAAVWNYENTQAPYKSLSVIFNRGHGFAECYMTRVGVFLGINTEDDLKDCINEANKNGQQDWKLSTADSKWRNFWNHIKTPIDVQGREEQLAGLEGFQSQGVLKFNPVFQGIPKPNYHKEGTIASADKSSMMKIVVIFMGGLPIVGILCCLIYKLFFRSRSDRQ